MPETNDDNISELNSKVQRLEKQIEELKTTKKKEEELGFLTDALVKRATESLLNSGTFRFVKLLLLGIIVFGIAVWGFGIFYSDWKIETVTGHADKAISSISIEKDNVIQKSSDFEKLVDQNSAHYSKLMKEQIRAAIGQVTESSENAVGLINGKRDDTLEKLDIPHIQFLQDVNWAVGEKVRELEGNLKKVVDEEGAILPSIEQKDNNFIWALTGISILALCLSIYAVWK